MIRNLKALGLALVAVFAMSAMAASAAQAEDANFAADGYSATIDATGDNDQVFVSPVGTLNCTHFDPHEEVTDTSVHGTGSLTAESPTLTAEDITYTNCHALGGLFGVTVDMNECHYTFDAGTMVGAGTATGSVDITGCDDETGISITVFEFGDTKHEEPPICTIDVPEQTPSEGSIHYENVANGDVTVTAEDVVVDTHVTAGGICNEEEGDSTYNGAFLAEGTDAEEEPTDIEVTGTE